MNVAILFLDRKQYIWDWMAGYDYDKIKYFKASRAYNRLLNEDPADYVHNGLSSSWDGHISDENLENSYLYHKVHEIEGYLNGIMVGRAEHEIDANSYIPLPYDLLDSYIDSFIEKQISEVSFEFPYGSNEFHRKFQTDECSYAISNVIENGIEGIGTIYDIDEVHKFNA